MSTAALQEWSACCRALGDGRLTLLVRKGGIHERHGGLFVPEQERFWLMPTHLHQDAGRLKPAFQGDVTPPATTPGIPIALWAESMQVWKVTQLARITALGDELMWTDAELATRFAYRDQPWLFVLLLRVHRLAAPVTIPTDPSYAGCRSWLTLTAPPADPVAAVPVLDDTAFAHRRHRIAAILDPAA